MTSADLGFAALAMVALLAMLAFVQWVKRRDYALGRQAFRDGLTRNPLWGADVLRGWDEAFEDKFARFK